MICPSVSPENSFRNNGDICKLDYASAFDMGLVRQSLKNALELSNNEELKSEISEKYPLLYPFKESKNGICEWHEDFETPEKGHRHFSPLYGFYPGNIIGFYKISNKPNGFKSFSNTALRIRDSISVGQRRGQSVSAHDFVIRRQ